MDKNFKEEDNVALEMPETVVADVVAEEILKEEEMKVRPTILLLILLIGLIFLTSSVFFAMVGPSFKKPSDNVINTGSILFSYNNVTSNIEIENAYPITDEDGKNLNIANQYFDFVISVDFENTEKKNLNYEISLQPAETNTIEQEFIRIYLLENKQEVLINKKPINNFSELSDSEIRNGAKTLIKVNVTQKTLNNYVFRMWLSDKYEIPETVKEFKCTVMVDAY